MHICIPVFEISQTGGAERYTFQVAVELARRGHSVTFVAPPAATVLPEGAGFVPVPALRSRHTVARLANFASFGLRSTRRVRAIDPRAVVYRPVGGSFGPGVVTAHSCHAAWVRARPRGARWRSHLFDKVFLAQERATFRSPGTRVSAVSTSCAAQISELYGVPRADIAVAQPAVDSAAFHRRTPDDRRRARGFYDIEPDRFTIGTVANHADQCKRLDLTIQTAHQLDATLLVVGHSDVRSKVREISSSMGADVRFLGLVDDMHRMYSALDVFAQPSILESYGMAAHEAMAVGVATVVTNTCGIATALTGAREAVVVDRDDADALLEAVRALRHEDRRAEQAERGCVWAHRRGWPDVVDDLMPLLEAEHLRLGGS